MSTQTELSGPIYSSLGRIILLSALCSIIFAAQPEVLPMTNNGVNKSIALAVVKNGKKLKGQKMFVPMKNKIINVTITDTVFLDKENKRLNV